jgi:hypothetical protein
MTDGPGIKTYTSKVMDCRVRVLLECKSDIMVIAMRVLKDTTRSANKCYLSVPPLCAFTIGLLTGAK